MLRAIEGMLRNVAAVCQSKHENTWPHAVSQQLLLSQPRLEAAPQQSAEQQSESAIGFNVANADDPLWM